MLKALLFCCLASFTAFGVPPEPQESEAKANSAVAAGIVSREAGLAKAIEEHELRHYELHRFFIPVTQGNLQWLIARIGARPDEALVVWKLMRGWDASRAARFAAARSDSRNPS